MAGPHWDQDRFHDATEAEIVAFTAALEGADLTAPVPTCPDWDLAGLVRHLGGVHRWARGMVRVLTERRLGLREIGVTFPAESGGLPEWLAEGGDALLGVLRAADPDASMWSWGADQNVRFWSRRMLHESAVHRCDAEIAVGLVPEVDARVAEDGVGEFLDNLPYAVAFAPKVENLRGDGETLAFAADDLDARWTVRLGPEGFTWARDDDGTGGAGAVVRGTASDLYLFQWGRIRPEDTRLTVTGDEALLAHWVANAAI